MRLYDPNPAITIGIFNRETRILESLMVYRDNYAFDGRKQCDLLVAVLDDAKALSLTNPPF